MRKITWQGVLVGLILAPIVLPMIYGMLPSNIVNMLPGSGNISHNRKEETATQGR